MVSEEFLLSELIFQHFNFLLNNLNSIKERIIAFPAGVFQTPIFPMGTGQKRALDIAAHGDDHIHRRDIGQQLTILVHKAPKKQIVREDKFLHVYTPEIEQQNIDKQVNNWWQQAAKRYYQSIVDKLYPIIEKHGIAKPIICVKKMSTLWGSCSRKRGKVNLNFYLYKASVPCIEYVILHELAHFLYPSHNKDFYDFLTIHMPDWQERKKQLDYEFVLGI